MHAYMHACMHAYKHTDMIQGPRALPPKERGPTVAVAAAGAILVHMYL